MKTMKKLQKVVSGIALMGALAFGYNSNVNAQVAPTKVATETLIIHNKDATGTPLQRVEIGSDAWKLKYDVNFKLNNDVKPVNVGLFALNKLYSKNNTSIGAEVFQVGNFSANRSIILGI
jgi:Phr family secreted Rap phosphatase inhibitor